MEENRCSIGLDKKDLEIVKGGDWRIFRVKNKQKYEIKLNGRLEIGILIGAV